VRVSILVPLRPERGPIGTARRANWKWIKRRWKAHFPEAEIVMGTDDGTNPFSKTSAINDAYSRSTGDMLVLADADSWVDLPQLVTGLHYAEKLGVLVVPWTSAHRLSEGDSQALLASDPAEPSPVTAQMRRQADAYRPSPSTAAMLVIVTRDGFERVGGMDARFAGWGGEDVAFALACDTLLGRKHIMPGEGFALHHERPRKKGLRVWQADPGHHNAELGDRYWAARGHPQVMLSLCAEHPLEGARLPVGIAPGAHKRPIGQLAAVLNPADDVPARVLVREFQGGVLRDGDTVRA
jgi:hypothetical protein